MEVDNQQILDVLTRLDKKINKTPINHMANFWMIVVSSLVISGAVGLFTATWASQKNAIVVQSQIRAMKATMRTEYINDNYNFKAISDKLHINFIYHDITPAR